MLKYSLRLAIIFLALTLSGCIGLRSHKLPEISPLDLEVNSPKKVKIFIDWKFNTGSSNAEHTQGQKQKQILTELINETGCCDIVIDPKEADLLLHGSFNSGASSVALIFSAITGASFYTIPSWINIEPQILANVSKGDKIYTYDLKDSAFMAQWLPFIITMPFRENPIKMESKMSNNLYRNLLLQMKKDGLFGS